jgi:hypothetical protein
MCMTTQRDLHNVTTSEECFSWILRRVALVRTDVSRERSASVIRATRIDEPGKTLAVTSNRLTQRRNRTLHTNILHSISTQRASVASYA